MNGTQRIIKNTIMLYIRMLFAMGVALYISRIVLQELGVVDFGIYGVVGGIVTMLMFLNGSLSTATSRFLAFELGKGDEEAVKETFKAAFMAHLFIAGIIFVMAETIGLWFLENKLVIPDERMNAARVVYQCSVLTCLLSITQAPYNAAIIAHERMEVYTYITIIDSALKLGVVFLLSLFHVDKLILYAVLLLIVWIIICSTYRIYCAYKFSECHWAWKYDRKRCKAILFFSGWNLIGSLGASFRGQGVNMLQNMFFGAIVNAATSIGNQFFAALSTFSDSFLAAIRPQIVKNYAVMNYKRVESLVVNASKFAFLLLSLFAIPLFLESDIVLQIWLKEVPPYAASFCQLNILICLMFVISQPVVYAIHATGNVKYLNLYMGILYISILPISYMFFRLDYSPIVPYYISLAVFVLCAWGYLFLLKKYMNMFSIAQYILQVYCRCACVFLPAFAIAWFVHNGMTYGMWRFVVVLMVSVVSILCFSYIIAINEHTRKQIKSKLKNLLVRR